MGGENVSHRSRVGRSRGTFPHDDRASDGITKAAGEESSSLRIRETNPMLDKLKSPEKQQPMQLTTDFLGEDRHEFVAKLAYTLWEGRDRPFGSPEVDWFAAERALYSSLVASGSVTPSPNAAQHIAERLYW